MKQQLKKENRMRIVLPAISVNEGVARAAVAAFCAQYDPSLSDLADIKCAVSEAVTNCIVHAYRKREGDVTITVRRIGEGVRIAVRDHGCGIADVARARQPLFTTDPQDERSGMGFTVMESFSDRLCVHSIPGKGTTVVMTKYFRTESN